MTMGLSDDGGSKEVVDGDDDPLDRYCGIVKQYLEQNSEPRKLESYLNDPDNKDRIRFEIESDEKGGEPQEYELLYVSHSQPSLCID